MEFLFSPGPVDKGRFLAPVKELNIVYDNIYIHIIYRAAIEYDILTIFNDFLIYIIL